MNKDDQEKYDREVFVKICSQLGSEELRVLSGEIAASAATGALMSKIILKKMGITVDEKIFDPMFLSLLGEMIKGLKCESADKEMNLGLEFASSAKSVIFNMFRESGEKDCDEKCYKCPGDVLEECCKKNEDDKGIIFPCYDY